MIASTQITNTEIFAFIAVLAFKLLSLKILFLNYFLRKYQISRVNYCKIINSCYVKFSRYFWNAQAMIYQCFFNLYGFTFNKQILQQNFDWTTGYVHTLYTL